MKTESKILVCTDFSPTSDLALKAAKELAQKSKSSLHILHVCEYPQQWDWTVSEFMANYPTEKFEGDLLENSRKRLDESLAALDITGEAHVLLGIPHQGIQSFISDKKIDLLVMGHKGKGETLFHIGGLANKMIASSPIPVLVIKSKTHMNKVAGLLDPNGPMKEVISATETLGKTLSSPIEFVSLVADLSARFIGVGKLGFSTKLLTLTDDERNEVKKSIRDKIHKELSPDSKAEIKVEITVEKNLSFHLNSILEGDHTDVAVMKRHQSGLLEKILIGSETRRMIEIFEGNLLILPA